MQRKLRVILDTNIYRMLLDKTYYIDSIENAKNIVIYGSQLIRTELRNTPKELKQKGKNVRMILLRLYDKFVKKKHEIKIKQLTEDITEMYLNEYRGHVSKKNLKKDYLIVAAASINGLDIIVSEDNKTMLSEYSQEAYKKVNKENNLKIPKFYSLEKLSKLLGS